MATERSGGGGGGLRNYHLMGIILLMTGLLSLLPFFLLHGQLEILAPPTSPVYDDALSLKEGNINKNVMTATNNANRWSSATSALPPGTVIRDDVSSPFCQRWSSVDAANRTLQPFDEWYTHHPNWIITNETEDMFCIEPYCEKGSTSYPCPNDRRSNLVNDFWRYYNNQFRSSCDKVHYRSMWSSGWSADFLNVQEGLIDATNNFHVPLVMAAPWHYAAVKKDNSHRSCSQADLTCYFLPYHSCGSLDDVCGFTPREFGMTIEECTGTKVERITTEKILDQVEIWHERGYYAYQFMTRKQLWLRRAVFDFKHKFRMKHGPESDCSVLHVRRADIIFHEQHARKYHPIADYVKLIPKEKLNDPNHTIFLLTDDDNAVNEAHEFYPNLRWKYIDRPRHSGSSGGWENQTPSLNPALELIVLMATFELAQDCSSFVHGHSGLSDYIWTHMAANAGNKRVTRLRVDDRKEVFNEKYLHSEEELAKLLDEKRAIKGGIKPTKIETVETAVTSSTDLDDSCTHQSDSSGGGVIIVNLLGLLANNLFEVAFAKMLASQLGCSWHVVYRSSWNTAFPTPQTDRCFPNALAKNNNRSGDKTQLLKLIQQIGVNQDVHRIFDAVTFNDLELEDSEHNNIFSDQSDANDVKVEWIKTFGQKALVIDHEEYHNEREEVIEPSNVLSILNDKPKVRVLDLNAFFINYRWMDGRMDNISQWLHIDPSCCTTPPPGNDAIVIHIRDFLPDDEDKNKNLQVGVYRDIIQQYSQSDQPKVIVVCQPRSVESDIVKSLVQEFNAVVQTGSDNIDAFCVLSNAHFIIPTTSSTYSQLAALLAQQKNDNVQVHYPTHTLDRPGVTLNVPTWKYHLTTSGNDRIEEFEVSHERLDIFHA
ncbi:hypothetical protein QTG54_011116 [Skeletonema marinoi]|uniref:Uncharacterized protein n=1 Tax=Skeletonema marinoi TaxID=267567 RepID=A0AAD9D8X7_9STRA|nr:hypothetical protein QTG54_011116 [Skeletonema marinoi]